MLRRALCIALLLGPIGHALAEGRSAAPYFTRQRLTAALQSQHIDVFRVNGGSYDEPPPTPDAATPHIGGYPITRGPFAVAPELLSRVRQTVFDPQHYVLLGPGEHLVCGRFAPGVALRFAARNPAAQPVEILLCFECDDIAVVLDGARGQLRYSDMSQGRLALLELAIALLPADASQDLARKLEPYRESERELEHEQRAFAQLPAAARKRLDPSQLPLTFPHGMERIAAGIARAVPRRELLIATCRAYGERADDWSGSADWQLVLDSAFAKLDARELSEVLRALQDDPSARMGAARLAFARQTALAGYDDAIAPQLAELAEFVLARGPAERQLRVVRSLRNYPSPATIGLLQRVAHGELAPEARRAAASALEEMKAVE